MKWNMLLATLLVTFVCSQATAGGLLNQMLGTGCGFDTSCCQTPKCCTPKPRCCMPKPYCSVPVAATCCAPEPTCCAPEATCAAPSACDTCATSCCKKKHRTPLRDALHNLFSCKKSHCGSSCGCEPSCAAPEASCCAPEATCAAPSACGTPSCGSSCHKGFGLFSGKCGCQKSCTPLKDAIARLFCCKKSCGTSCGCDTGCDAGCGDGCGCGATYSAPAEAGEPTEADMMPPAPVPADTMTYVPARRRLVSVH